MPRMVNVIFCDGMAESVPASLLKELIELREIVAFERREGWAYVGHTPVRKKLRPTQDIGKRAYDIYLLQKKTT